MVYYILRVFFTCNFDNFVNFNGFVYFDYFDKIFMIKLICGRTYVNGYINNIYNSGHYCLRMSERDILELT